MATFHWHMQVIRRGDGRSAVAAAAYRSGSRLIDERTGLAHDFRRRRGVGHREIILPPGADIALADRAHLWNRAEAAERRRDAAVAREAVVALPHELPHTAQVALLTAHARHIAELLGVAVDAALHLPGERRPRRAPAAAGLPGADPRNTHGHLMWTTRRVSGPDAGKKTRALDDRKTGSAIVEALRADWEARVNAALCQASIAARVDRRSRAARGDAAAPMPKLGPAAAALERQGVATERGRSWRGVRDDNAALADVARIIDALEAQRVAMRRRQKESQDVDEEIAILLARRRPLEKELRPIAPPLDIEAAFGRLGDGDHRRCSARLAMARRQEREERARAAALPWWQIVARWRARQNAARRAAHIAAAEQALRAFAETYAATASRMIAADRERYRRELAQQDENRRALAVVDDAIDIARRHRLRLAMTAGAVAEHAVPLLRAPDLVR